MTNSNVRKRVMAQIVGFMAEAKDRGEDPIKAAQAAFPGTPTMVLYEAEVNLDLDEVESWWRSVEKTIDGEIIRNALAKPGDAQ